MYRVSAQGVDERMINVNYYYYACTVCVYASGAVNTHVLFGRFVCFMHKKNKNKILHMFK